MSRKPEPLILADPLFLARGDWMFDENSFETDPKTGLPVPYWTMQGAAWTFFGCRVENLRRRVKRHYFTLTEHPECPHSNLKANGVLLNGKFNWVNEWLFNDDMECSNCGGVDWGSKYVRNAAGEHIFTLASVERMAAVLGRKHDIGGGNVERVTKIARFIGEQWDCI